MAIFPQSGGGLCLLAPTSVDNTEEENVQQIVLLLSLYRKFLVIQR